MLVDLGIEGKALASDPSGLVELPVVLTTEEGATAPLGKTLIVSSMSSESAAGRQKVVTPPRGVAAMESIFVRRNSAHDGDAGSVLFRGLSTTYVVAIGAPCLPVKH